MTIEGSYQATLDAYGLTLSEIVQFAESLNIPVGEKSLTFTVNSDGYASFSWTQEYEWAEND